MCCATQRIASLRGLCKCVNRSLSEHPGLSSCPTAATMAEFFLRYVQDNYNKMASEPKPKKPRKKSKPPALTRPPKRGKKKSKQRSPGYSPCLGPSLCLQQPSSPASSSSSCSCSSRSPPFLGSCEAAPIPSSVADVEPLLLSDLLPQPHERLHLQQHERLHVQQSQPKPQLHLVQQPHLQLQPRAAGLGLVVRVKTKPKPVATAAATTTTTTATTLTTQVHVAPHSLTSHLPVAAPLVASTPGECFVILQFHFPGNCGYVEMVLRERSL